MPAQATETRPEPARRPGGRTAAVRRRVFDATLELLAAQGYEALSIEAIATAAGVNKTTIYRNWPTRGRLVQAAALDRSAAVIRVSATGDLERDLADMLQSVADYITSPVGHGLIVAAVNDSGHPASREGSAEFWAVRFAAVREVIKNDLGPIDSRLADDAIEHMIGPLYLRVFVTGAPIDRPLIERLAAAGARLLRDSTAGTH
jgi:AcrR family transcriptional regulator